MDAARSALRLGAEQVIIIYRRGRDEYRRAEEVHHALRRVCSWSFSQIPLK